jgi:hypothetical protein
MKISAIVTIAALAVVACGDDTIVTDAGEEAGTDGTTLNDVTQDTTQQDTTPPSDAPGDTTVSDSPSDAPSDTGLLDVATDALAAHCSNQQKDVDETDVDCGGLACPKCMSGKKCLADTDCTSNICKGNKTCQ